MHEQIEFVKGKNCSTRYNLPPIKNVGFMTQSLSLPSFTERIKTLADQLNWDCRASALTTGSLILNHLSSDRILLRAMVENLIDDLDLFPLCERYDFFDKLMIYKDPFERFKIRMSIFSPFISNRPHFHRWSYVAMILKGRYVQSIFGRESEFSDASFDAFQPMLVHEVSADAPYFLHHSCVHAVKAESGTVSLLLQGPPQKDRFWVIDQKIERRWWEYGSELETTDEKQRKQISRERLVELINFLISEKVI